MSIKIDLVIEIKKIILNTKSLVKRYTNNYPNKKYLLDDIIEELLYFLKSGVSWRMLRSHINYKTLYWHYTYFVQNNVFVRLFNKIKTVYCKKYLKFNQNINMLIDSSVVPNKNGINKLGRNKFYKNKKVTKVSLMTDCNGFPLSILFLKGNYHDNSVFERHIKDALIILPNKSKRILADKAYSSKYNYELLDNVNINHIIPPRRNMKLYTTYKYDKTIYRKRIKIENVFGIIKNYKRISIRYDKLLRNYQGFIYLALTNMAINIIKKVT